GTITLSARANRRRTMCATSSGLIGTITRARGHRRGGMTVLNAFRLHRNDHSPGGSSSTASGGVLNAFRLHRNDHGRVLLHGVRTGACSTPSGFLGTITGATVGSARRRECATHSSLIAKNHDAQVLSH